MEVVSDETEGFPKWFFPGSGAVVDPPEAHTSRSVSDTKNCRHKSPTDPEIAANKPSNEQKDTVQRRRVSIGGECVLRTG